MYDRVQKRGTLLPEIERTVWSDPAAVGAPAAWIRTRECSGCWLHRFRHHAGVCVCAVEPSRRLAGAADSSRRLVRKYGAGHVGVMVVFSSRYAATLYFEVSDDEELIQHVQPRQR